MVYHLKRAEKKSEHVKLRVEFSEPFEKQFKCNFVWNWRGLTSAQRCERINVHTNGMYCACGW